MKHFCSTFSCLLSLASISSLAQVNLGSVNVGSSSLAAVTLTIPAAGKWSFFVGTGGNANADFTNAGGGTCNTNTLYSAGATCTVQVAFTPKGAGVRYGAITLTSQSFSASPQSTYLKGIGTAPQISFIPGSGASIYATPNPRGIAVDGSDDVFIVGGSYGSGGGFQLGSLAILQPSGDGSYVLRAPAGQSPSPLGAWSDQAGNFYENDLETGMAKNGSFILYGVQPTSLAGDASATLFVTTSGSSSVSEFTLQPSSLFPPQLAYIQTGTVGSGFIAPSQVWTDGLGNVYVLDSGTLYKETLEAGGGYLQTPLAAGSSPFTTTFVDPSGNLYGYPSGSTQLTKQTLQTDGSFVASNIFVPVSNASNLTFDNAGNLYYAYPASDSLYGLIWTENFASPASLTFASTARGSVSAGGPQGVTITNTGNDPLQFSSVTYPVDFPESMPATGHCTATTSLPAGESCLVSVQFAPVTPIPGGRSSAVLTEKISITTNTANKPGTAQKFAVAGTETPGTLPVKIATTTNLSGNPSTNITVGEKIVLTITVKPVSGTAIPAGKVTLASTISASTLTVNLDAMGKAIVNTVAPAKGMMTLYATYNGSATDAASVSAILSTVVK